MASKFACIFVCLFLVSTMTVVTEGAVQGDPKNCLLSPPDYVPEGIKKCFKNTPIKCDGKTVSYKYTDVLPSLPCIIGTYGINGLLKMHHCGYDVAHSVKPGLEIHVHENELRKFYGCFNDGKW